MIALFRSQNTIGKSILQLDTIVRLAQEARLEQLVVVEDNFYGFRELNQSCIDKKIPLVFGLRLPVVYESMSEQPSKLIFFAKNNEGLKTIKNLYSKTYQTDENVLVFSQEKSNLQDIKIGVPFYDSFVYNNVFHFGMSVMDLDETDHFFFEEDNQHPFDFQIKRALDNLGVSTVLAKTICYENREDCEAFQMLRAISDRAQGKTPTFGNPNLNHFCSTEFCWESWKEKNARIL